MKRILILLAFCSLMTIAPSCLTTRDYGYDRDDRRDDNGGILIERNKRIVRDGDSDRDRAITRRERREERREQRERERERRNMDTDKPVIVVDPNR